MMNKNLKIYLCIISITYILSNFLQKKDNIRTNLKYYIYIIIYFFMYIALDVLYIERVTIKMLDTILINSHFATKYYYIYYIC